jgi:hypothetical protein
VNLVLVKVLELPPELLLSGGDAISPERLSGLLVASADGSFSLRAPFQE